MWAPEVLGSPTQGPAICSPHGHYLRLDLLIVCGFPQQMFHISSFSNFLGSPLQLRLHPHSCKDSDPATHYLASYAFLWNLGGSLYDPKTLAFCMPPKPASHRWHQSLHQLRPIWTIAAVASECLHGWLCGSTSLGSSVQAGLVTCSYLLKAISLKWIQTFHSWLCDGWGPANFWDAL
jgi:hypothetical protein